MSAMRPLTDGTRLARFAAAGDVIALLAFLVVGLDRHAENASGRFVALAAIFVGSWLVTAWVVGAYRPISNPRLALTLVLAVPLAVLIRAAIVQAWTIGQVALFVAVALLFCALFVGAMRAAILLAFRRDARA
jgi:hypothetical protein